MRCSLIILLLFTGFKSTAQSFNNISSFTTQNGLSNNSISSLVKDEDGFLWIGTHEGLNRYDGTEFTNILSNPVNNLPSNTIGKICLINKTTLAVSTEGGLCFLNTKTLAGKKTGKAPAGQPYQPIDAIWDMYFDKKEKELWIGTADALYVLSEAGELKRKMYSADHSGAVFARHFFADAKGAVFIYTQKQPGFFYPDFKRNALVPAEYIFPGLPLNQLLQKNYTLRGATFIDDKITCCFSGNNLINKTNLIYYYDNRTKYCCTDSFSARSTNNNFLSDAYPVSDSLLLVNSYFGEPYLYNPFTKNIRQASAQPLWFSSWPDGIYARLLVDRQNIWIATPKALLQAPQFPAVFKTNDALVSRLNENKSLISYNYGTWYKNKFWLACLGTGAFATDTLTKTTMAVFNEKTPAIFKSKTIATEILNAGDNLWLCSIYGTLCINPATGKLSVINAANKDSLFDDHSIYPLTDHKGNIWMTVTQGLTMYSPATNTFTNYKTKRYGGPVPVARTYCKTEDGSGNIWFTSRDTLVKFNPAANTFTVIPLLINRTSAGITDCLESNGGDLLYMHINGAFAVYHISTRSFDLYTKKTGLISTSINQVQADKEGNAWLATEGGLVYYNYKTQQFSSYTKTDGLPDDNVTAINYTDASKTQLFIGFSRSYCTFDPAQLLAKKNTPILNTITGIEVNGQAILFDEAKTFSYRENNISFFYTGINFTAGIQNSYAYMLEGFDKDWTYCDKKRQCNYLNLPPGHYTFKIKSADPQGLWNEVPASFSFTITAPFWQTTWFRVLAVLASILFIYAFIRRRDAVREKQNDLQLQMSELRLQAVQSQMNPHFIFNSLNSIQNFIVQNNQVEAARYLSRFSKLIRRILDNSHHQFLKLEDILETLKMYVELEAFRFNKEFTYGFDVDSSDERIYDIELPPMLLQPFVENAILHGLMPKEGDKHLKIMLFIKDNILHCIIEDNGTGRKERTDNTHISRGEKLTKSMLESIRYMQKAEATITYTDLKNENNNPAGTIVTIKIPVA